MLPGKPVYYIGGIANTVILAKDMRRCLLSPMTASHCDGSLPLKKQGKIYGHRGNLGACRLTRKWTGFVPRL
jgi:hypothetical protein